MKNFKQLVNELPSRKIVFTFGRFQPPTVGHELLVKAVQRVAKSQKADHVIYTSRSQDKKKNPLDVKRKVYYLKRMFPQANIVGAGETTRTFIEVAKELNKRYKQIVMVAGSDRVTEYNRILNEYNGKEFNFETIQVVSAGERDPDADDASGMSGTKMRELAKKGDFNTFKKGLPSTLTTTDARRLMNDIRVGIGMEELKEEVKFETDLLREMYHKGDIFLVGQIVESKGQKFEIVDRGANYLSVVDRKGNISKKWLSDVKMVKSIKEDYTATGMGETNQITYKGYTTKNFDHDKGAVDAFLHTIAKSKDPVATLNAIKATDNWLGIIKKALDTDTYTKQDSRDFYTNIRKAQDALNNMDEFLHHLDYFNNHVHDMERIATQYHTDTDEQGQESYVPTGELLEMKFMAGDKIKVARIIATTLGVTDVEKTSSPTQLVNAGLRLIRNKPMRTEYLDVIKKMLQTAKEAGIDYEESLVPSKAKEMKESFKQFLAKEAVDELPTADTKLDKRGRKIPAHKIVFNPNEVEYQKKDIKESGGPVVFKKGNDHIEKYGDDSFAVYKDGKKTKYYKTMDDAKSALNEISSKLAGDYYGAATKKHIDKVGVKSNMYDRIEKDMGAKRKAGVDRAMDRVMGARKTNEEATDYHAQAEMHMSLANDADKEGDKKSFHSHMADHHDSLSMWHDSKGRSATADKHAEKADYHHEKSLSEAKTVPESYTIAKDIMKYSDLKKSMKMNKGIQEVETKVLDPESEKPKLGHESMPQGTIGHADVTRETSKVIAPSNQNGSSYTGDESLRRRKAYHKMHEEVQTASMSGKADDLEDEDFEDEIEKIKDPEHIMHLYDDEEFMEDNDENDTEEADKDEGEDDDEEDDKKEVNEAIGRIERMKRGIRFKRTSSKRERLKAIALKRMSSSGVIQKRARRHAVIMMKQRLARKPLDTLSTQEKERLENFIQKRKALINRLAQRIAPKIRKIEKDRLQKRKSK